MEERAQTFDGLVEAPVIYLIMLIIIGLGIFKTMRLSLIMTFIMVLPLIDAAIALGLDADHWDPDSPGKIVSADQAILHLTVMKYACYAFIAIVTVMAVLRALAKTRADKLETIKP
jgi:hypothetical protein